MTWPFTPLVPLSYGAVMIDPPWRFEVWSGDKVRDLKGSRAAERHYRTMSLAEIRALPVGHLLRGDGVLFMWILDTHMQHALDTIKAWGLVYKKIGFIWVKTSKAGQPRMSTGYWSRNGAEVCLMATTGRPHRLDKGVAQVLLEPPREHSRKPEEFRRRIERLVRGPYCEVFSRTDRPGWDCWGDQTGAFTDAA